MKSTAATAQKTNPARPAEPPAALQSQTATTGARELQGTLAEVSETITMVEHALAPVSHPSDEDDRYKALIDACGNGNLAEVRRLLATGIDVNHRYFGITPLHVATVNGHLGIVQELLERGAEVDATCLAAGPQGETLEGATSFYLATARRIYSIARLLLSYGANPAAKPTKVVK